MFNRYDLAGVCSIIFWSCSIAFSRSLSEQIGPFTAATIIYLAGGVISLLIYKAINPNFTIDKIKQFDKKYLYGCGLLFVLYIATLFLALDKAQTRTNVIVVGLINYLWIPLTIICSVYLLNMPYKLTLFAGLFIATLGVILAMSNDINPHQLRETFLPNLASYIFALIAAISWALYSTLTKKWAISANNAVPIFMIASSIFLALMLPIRNEHRIWTNKTICELIFMIAFNTSAYVLWDIAMKKGNIKLIIPLSYSIPFLSTVIIILYLGANISFIMFIGVILVIIGAYISYSSIHATKIK